MFHSIASPLWRRSPACLSGADYLVRPDPVTPRFQADSLGGLCRQLGSATGHLPRNSRDRVLHARLWLIWLPGRAHSQPNAGFVNISMGEVAARLTLCTAGFFHGITGAIHSVVGELCDETNESIAFPLYDIISALGFAIGYVHVHPTTPAEAALARNLVRASQPDRDPT